MNDMRVELERMVNETLNTLYDKDEYLIKHEPVDLSHGKDGHVSERSIVARFAIYFQNLLYRHNGLMDYNLDVEYNRNLSKPKCLPNTKWKGNGAYPDLLIHKRGRNDGNILIVEFKTHWNKCLSDVNDDIIKLQAFMEAPYFYMNALFILLEKSNPQIHWVDGNTTGEVILNG